MLYINQLSQISENKSAGKEPVCSMSVSNVAAEVLFPTPNTTEQSIAEVLSCNDGISHTESNNLSRYIMITFLKLFMSFGV